MSKSNQKSPRAGYEFKQKFLINPERETENSYSYQHQLINRA